MHTHFLLWIDLISHGNLVYDNRTHTGVRLGWLASYRLAAWT